MKFLSEAISVWTLNCEHFIICDCVHRIGEKVYCSKCNSWKKIDRWARYVTKQ